MNKLTNQKGFAHILLLILVLVIIAAGVVYFILPKLGVNLPVPGVKQEPKVILKTEYQNPFKKESQYVNPFDQYKSPLVNLKK